MNFTRVKFSVLVFEKAAANLVDNEKIVEVNLALVVTKVKLVNFP